MVQIVVITREHPTELSAKFIGRQIADVLSSKGHNVVLAEMPVRYSSLKLVSEVHKGRIDASGLKDKAGETGRFVFLTEVYNKFPKALILSFHNSLPNEPLNFQQKVLKKTPDKQAVSFSKLNPVVYLPDRRFPNIVAVEIPAIFKAMPAHWRKKVYEVAKRTGFCLQGILTLAWMLRQAGLLDCLVREWLSRFLDWLERGFRVLNLVLEGLWESL